MKNKYPAILMIIAVISHHQWFNFASILNNADWSYWPQEALRQLWVIWGTWLSYISCGIVNVQIYFYPFFFLWSLFGNLGFSYDFATKITVLIPIAILGFISPYLLFRKLTKQELVSFIVALFYGATTYFLMRQTEHLFIAFVYALAPLVFYYLIKALDKNKLVHWLSFSLVYWVCACYELRITYIVTFVLCIYFIFFNLSAIKKYWKNILIIFLTLLGLNSFWFFPVVFGRISENISDIANRGLFGGFLFNITHAFILLDINWTGGYPGSPFIMQSIIWYFWLIPIMVFSVFLFNKNSKYKKEVIFFGIVAFIGIFLTKQSAYPLAGAYKWLYNNFPGFSLFREASKFFLLTALGYTGLLAYGLLILKESNNKILNRYLFSFFSLFIIFLFVVNIKPLVTGEIGKMFASKKMPSDYVILNNFLSKQNDYYRTLWTPVGSRWGLFTDEKPKFNSTDILPELSSWSHNSDKLKADFINEPLEKQITEIYKKPFANQLFDIYAIKYVIVPIRDVANDDDFYIYYGNDPSLFINELSYISYLRKIDIGTKDLVVYENQDLRPHIYSTKEPETIYKTVPYENIKWQFLSPTNYKITLKNLKNPIFINFSEEYHEGWKLRVGKLNWLEALLDKEYFIADDNHIENDAFLNTFYVSPEDICKKYQCKNNNDGSFDIDLALYFYPQSYFYFGLIISGFALLAVLGYLILAKKINMEQCYETDKKENNKDL